MTADGGTLLTGEGSDVKNVEKKLEKNLKNCFLYTMFPIIIPRIEELWEEQTCFEFHK